MKKLLSLLVAIVMTSSLFATDYYLTVKSNNTAEGEVSWSESSGFGATAARIKVGTNYTNTKTFYVKAKTGKQFAYAKSSYSTNTWYINSSTSTMWGSSPTWRSGSGTQMFTVKLSNLGYTSTSSKTDGTFTIYFKDLNVLTFKNEDGTTLKTYQLRDNEATPSTSDLFSIRPTKAEDANYTYTFKGWYNGNTEYVGGYGKYITSNQTYTAVFTATRKESYVTATFNNYDGTQLAQYTNVVSGTKPTYSDATPTRADDLTNDKVTTYTFTGWEPDLDNITTNTTYTAQFSSSTTDRLYTIRFLMDDGVTELSTAQVAYNDNPIQPVEPSKIETEEYSYNFVGWDADNDGIADVVTPVTGDQDYVAVFEQVALTPKYTITIGALTNGSVTITTDGGTEFVPAAGGSYKYEEGTMVILKAKAERGYHFTEWNDGTETASRRIELTENTTLTPTFAANTLFELRDEWTESDCQNYYDMENVLTVTLTDRTFKQNEWATISLPFSCTLEQGDDMYGYIYKFGKVTLAADGGSINVEFNRTYEITANEPYLVVTQENITAPKFYGVSLVSPESVSLSSDGQVSFVSNLWKMTINGPRDFYVGNRSALRYAKTTGTVINANRAFFRKSEGAPAPRRLKVMIDGVETTMQITEEGDIEQAEETRKYVEDGILIIERNGVRYNATGAVAQ